jgi:rubrerythrin
VVERLMSRSAFRCRSCQAVIGHVSPAHVLHPDGPLAVLFIDHERQITDVQCPNCGARITVRRLRIDMTA